MYVLDNYCKVLNEKQNKKPKKLEWKRFSLKLGSYLIANNNNAHIV